MSLLSPPPEQLVERSKDRIFTRPIRWLLPHILPRNLARRRDEDRRGHRQILALHRHAVGLGHARALVAEQRKVEPEALTQLAGVGGRIDADRYNPDAASVELGFAFGQLT